MKPAKLSEVLRRIASGIDASEKPDPKLVAETLKKVLASLESEK